MNDPILLERALAGDREATRGLVEMLMPVVQARVARTLVRRRGTSGRDVRQEVEDVTQDVFAALFEESGRLLRAWDPARGLSLASFCGLIAEREAVSILRSGRRSPWTDEATELDDLEKSLAEVPDVEVRIASKEHLERLLDRVREALSPRGIELFHRLVLEEESVESVCKAMAMTPDAVYAWKSRILKVIRKLAAELTMSEPHLPGRAQTVASSPPDASDETLSSRTTRGDSQ